MNTLTFTTIQTKLHWENKDANLHMLKEKIMAIPSTQIVVLPEMFNTGFTINTALAESMDGPTIKWMKEIATTKKIILTGSLMVQENDRFYNRLIWTLPTGQFGHYDKRHLFAFAGEHQFITPGQKRLITSVNGWKINLQVCYDLRFPVWARQQMNNGEAEYDVLIYVANWPEKRNNAWKVLLQARAIENQCFVIGVNCTGLQNDKIRHSGDSMIIDPFGEILYHKTADEDIHTATLQKQSIDTIRSKWPFLDDADMFSIYP